jgi:hypothetical protein
VLGIGQDVVGHADFRTILESVQEIPVGDTFPAGLYGTSGQKGGQELLLQLEVVLSQDLQEVVKANLSTEPENIVKTAGNLHIYT